MKRDIMAWAAVATSAAEPEKLQVEYGRRKIVLTINDRAARVWRELRASILLPSRRGLNREVPP